MALGQPEDAVPGVGVPLGHDVEAEHASRGIGGPLAADRAVVRLEQGQAEAEGGGAAGAGVAARRPAGGDAGAVDPFVARRTGGRLVRQRRRLVRQRLVRRRAGVRGLPGRVAAVVFWSVQLAWRDIEAGRNAGCKTIFIEYNYDEKDPSTPPDVIVGSLSEAVDWILNQK